MSDIRKVIEPAFQITLDPDPLMRLGAFSAIWSQLDYFTGLTIAGILKTNISAAETFMEGMTTGPRINLLRRLSSNIEDQENRQKAKTFCTDMGPLIEKRNHLLHGIWGWYCPEIGGHTGACYYPKRRDSPIFTTELVDLCDDAAKQTHVIATVFRHVYKIAGVLPKEGERPPAFFFGPGPPPGMNTEVRLELLGASPSLDHSDTKHPDPPQ